MNVSFDDIAIKMSEFINKKITKKEFENWVNKNIKITEYMPLSKKYAMIKVFSDRFSEDMIDNDNELFMYMKYDIDKLFTFISYYINIDIPKSYFNIKNYDLVMESKLTDFIAKKTDDFDSLCKKCDTVSGINEFHVLKGFVDAMGNQPSVEEFEKIKNIINNEIDKDKLSIIDSIQKYNNSNLSKIENVVIPEK